MPVPGDVPDDTPFALAIELVELFLEDVRRTVLARSRPDGAVYEYVEFS